MKVCIFTGVISLDKANTDVRKNYLLERLKHINASDISITIISPFSKNIERFPQNNVFYQSYYFIDKKRLKMLSSFIFPLKKLIDVECDVLHCLNYQSYLIASFANIFRKNKYITLFEAMGLAYAESSVDSQSSFKVRFLRPLIKYFENYAFSNSDAVIVYTQSVKEFVTEYFNLKTNNVHVLPHGVNTGFVSPFLTHEFDIGFKAVDFTSIAMYVGSLSELHGTPFLMDTILELNRKRPDIFFFILGTGVLIERFESFIKKNQLKNVALLGYVPSNKIPLYMDKADVLLIPHSKCLQTELDSPTKLFEYMSAGKPIVSFDLKAIREVVGNKAVLVEADKPSAFAEGIIEVVDNKEHYLMIAQEAKSIANLYSWQIVAEKQLSIYTAIYEDLLYVSD